MSGLALLHCCTDSLGTVGYKSFQVAESFCGRSFASKTVGILHG